MKAELSGFELIQLALNLAFFVAAIWCIAELKGYRRMVQLMTADSPAVPTDPKLIEEWAEKYEALPTSSPKKVMYKKRLIEVGYFTDGD